ncbi:hypothetical protein GCM10019016_083580 [Streptomyces prasinosporus]|uniref:Uncharacterized protein n=1 Tax=Streptomyces prasinosporus TaxID=68256 RepID=A0ABP6U4M8_9ACTN
MADSASHGSGAAAYVFTACVSDGAVGDCCEAVFRVGLSSEVSGARQRAGGQRPSGRGEDDHRRQTGGQGDRQRKGTHGALLVGTVRRWSALRTGRQCHTLRQGAEGFNSLRRRAVTGRFRIGGRLPLFLCE